MYEEFLYEIAQANPDVVVMTAENRAALRSLPARLGPRFIDVGIAEQTLVGAAAGLALRGRVPVAHALAAFLTMRAFEFIRTDVGIARLPVKLVGAIPGFLSEANGPTHQALEDIALMRGIPSVNVFCPADEVELIEGMAHILRDDAPWYVRYNACTPAVDHRAPFAIGRAEILSEGTHVALLTYGCLLGQCRVAASLLEASGVSVRLINMRTLKPIDEQAIVGAALDTMLVVTVEDHFASGGLGTIVSEILTARQLPVRLHRLAMEERWFTPALLPDVLEREGFTGERIAARIRGVLAPLQKM